MTNSIAIGLAAIILLCLATDAVANDWQASIFLAKKTIDLIDWVEFWR